MQMYSHISVCSIKLQLQRQSSSDLLKNLPYYTFCYKPAVQKLKLGKNGRSQYHLKNFIQGAILIKPIWVEMSHSLFHKRRYFLAINGADFVFLIRPCLNT